MQAATWRPSTRATSYSSSARTSRARGRSLPYEGNACAYKLDYLSERCLEDLPDGTVILGREAEETSDEGSEAGGSSPEQAPQPSHQATQQLVVEEVN